MSYFLGEDRYIWYEIGPSDVIDEFFFIAERYNKKYWNDDEPLGHTQLDIIACELEENGGYIKSKPLWEGIRENTKTDYLVFDYLKNVNGSWFLKGFTIDHDHPCSFQIEHCEFPLHKLKKWLGLKDRCPNCLRYKHDGFYTTKWKCERLNNDYFEHLYREACKNNGRIKIGR